MADFEDAVEQISDEEKLQIAQHYLLSTPPGQFNEVLADVRKIVSPELLNDSRAIGIARVSNLKNNKVVISPTGNKVILCAAAEVDPTHYIDPKDSTVFAVDHLTHVTKEDLDVAFNQDVSQEGTRAAVQAAINKYVATTYKSEFASGCVYGKDGIIHIVVSGEKISLKNYWSGKWNSVWTLGPDGQLCGDIKIHVHYFEDGNLQLQSTKSIAATAIDMSAEASAAESVMKYIQDQESILHVGLDEMYDNMNEQTFKSVRRVMPITKQKMEWNINALRMIRQTTFKK